MPSKNTPVQTSAQSHASLVSPLAIERARDAAHIAIYGMDAVEELRAILRAIWKLSAQDDSIHGLATVGITLANDRLGVLGRDREEMEEMAALEGSNHA